MTELDLLMSTDWLTATDKDIDAVIAYQRKARMNFELGIKPKKEKGPAQDLTSVMAALQVTKPEEPTRRRR